MAQRGARRGGPGEPRRAPGPVLLKEGDSVAHLGPEGMAEGGRQGLFHADTRVIARWRWRLDGLVLADPGPVRIDRLDQVWRGGGITARRRVTLGAGVLRDGISLVNAGPGPRRVHLVLEVAADFADLFATYGAPPALTPLVQAGDGARLTAVHRDEDGVVSALAVDLRPAAPGGVWVLDLAPGGRAVVTAMARVETDLAGLGGPPLPRPEAWAAPFAPLIAAETVVGRAVADLRGLLLSLPEGPYPAAGLPAFATPFGRDGILTALFLLPERPDIARGVLGFLAARRGLRHDPVSGEAPGRILHEWRWGAWARLGLVPYGRSYGSIDATPLFLMLMGAYWTATGDRDALETLAPAWIAAADWVDGALEAGRGLIWFDGGGGGLRIQSWKDSDQGLPRADGSAAAPPLAVVEVQGYAVAALRAAADLFAVRSEAARAAQAEAAAKALVARIDARFWSKDLGCHALALEGRGDGITPLAVASSNPGHLLFCDAVPPERAEPLARRLLAPDLWSGWGLRTLSAEARAYDPLSYHDGSVWPHDTALFALGLARAGLVDEARAVARAILDLAAGAPDGRAPELVSGAARGPDAPPEPYPGACPIQAWSAAAVIAMARLVVPDRAARV